MQNITGKPHRNMGGNFKQFLFVPVGDADAIPYIINNNIADDITLGDGNTWYTADAVFETLKFVEKPIGDPGNPIGYDVRLSGAFAKDSLNLLQTVSEMEGKRFLVLVTDHNERQRLMGTLEKGCKFSSVFDSGEKIANRNEYAFEFTWQSGQRCPFYQGEAEENPGGGGEGGGEVEIIDQDGNVIETVTAPGEYEVIVFSGIQDTGPPYENSIVDNG